MLRLLRVFAIIRLESQAAAAAATQPGRVVNCPFIRLAGELVTRAPQFCQGTVAICRKVLYYEDLFYYSDKTTTTIVSETRQQLQ